MKPSDYVMPLGKYRGESLEDIASTDEGLRYLDWLVGQEWVNGRLKENLKAYLAIPSIARELEQLLGD